MSCCLAAAVLSGQGSMKPTALALHSSNWPGTEGLLHTLPFDSKGTSAVSEMP